MMKKLRRFYFLLLLMILSVLGSYGNYLQSEAGAASVEAGADTDEMVYASGVPIGIYIKTEGVLVLGLQKVKGKNGREYSPAEYKIKSGDYILKLNGDKVTSKKDFVEQLQKNGSREITLTIRRKDQEMKTKLHPVYSEENQLYQIGVWIRNDTQGIGTVTFLRKDGTFAALGHGISDSDLGVNLSIAGGSVYRAGISSIKKGEAGNPGEIIGTIDYVPENYLGTIDANTNGGISGKITKDQARFSSGELMPIAKKTEVKKGNAYLRSSISGKSRDYSIKIEKVTVNKKDSLKSLKIRVTDQKLIALTGGIIQGLSGSPIIQDGKLVGAVTHVLVDDPKEGYGILAEDMAGQ